MAAELRHGVCEAAQALRRRACLDAHGRRLWMVGRRLPTVQLGHIGCAVLPSSPSAPSSCRRKSTQPGHADGNSSLKTVGDYADVILKCSQVGDVKRAQQRFAELLRAGLTPDRKVYNALLKALGDSGKVAEAQRVLLEMEKDGDYAAPNLQSYLSVLKACERAGDWEKAEICFDAILDAGLSPPEEAYLSVIRACADSKNPIAAQEWFDKMVHDGHDAGVVAYNTMIMAHAKTGDVGSAKEWFAAMRDDRIAADSVTYMALGSAAVASGDMRAAESFLSQAIEAGKASPEVFNVLIHGYAKCDNLRAAQAAVCET
eukprot:TRINITY_DN22277_c0_g2_i2.p1 TRINITY_DN22277_c0_g2~~TRINITY_DN22277_c0_g2_i2.p1  ORF type:complete len:336 (-),score=72.77 TRINITY_DN22277_c0_g2_i2:119-1066(-)